MARLVGSLIQRGSRWLMVERTVIHSQCHCASTTKRFEFDASVPAAIRMTVPGNSRLSAVIAANEPQSRRRLARDMHRVKLVGTETFQRCVARPRRAEPRFMEFPSSPIKGRCETTTDQVRWNKA